VPAYFVALADFDRVDPSGRGTSKLKLWITGASLQPDWGGGEPVIAQELIAGLSSRGFEVLATPTGRSVGQLATMAASPWDWDAYSYLRYTKQLDKVKPDCVLGFYDYDSTLLRACVARQVPYVATVHIYWPVCPVGTLYIDGIGVCPGPGLTRCLRHMSNSVPPTRLPLGISWMPAPLGLGIYLKTRQRAAELRRAASIVVPSRRILEILQHFGLPNVTEVPNGMPLERIPSQVWTSGRKQILFASGASTERKGFTQFVELAQALGTSDKGVEFAATSFSGGGAVRGLGRLPHADVLREMRESYAVVAPSLWEEPFSVAVQEAMASGKAVVAYDVGGNSELLGDAGIVVPRGDAAALRAAVSELLSDETKAVRLGTKARERAEAMFQSGKMIDGYADALRKAA
jgi:glycosyltransferase involved in cell wall biosynthesis